MSVHCPVCGEGYPEGRPEAKAIEEYEDLAQQLHEALEAAVAALRFNGLDTPLQDEALARYEREVEG